MCDTRTIGTIVICRRSAVESYGSERVSRVRGEIDSAAIAGPSLPREPVPLALEELEELREL